MAESTKPSKKTNGSKKSKEKSSGKQAPDTKTTESELFVNRTNTYPKGEKVRLTKTDIERLEETYYKEGYTLGRDALYGVLKDEYAQQNMHGILRHMGIICVWCVMR